MPYVHPNPNLEKEKVQISGDFLGVCGLNSLHRGNSASRLHMASNQLGQILTLTNPDVKGIQSGSERQYGLYTDNVQMPCEAEIIDIIPLYPSLGRDNPQQTVIFQDKVTKEIGCLEMTKFRSNHQYFGFNCVDGKDLHKLKVGETLLKGDVLQESPNITPDGDYKFAVEPNLAFITLPATSEDGVLIRRKYLEKMGYYTFEERVVEFGTNQVLLNTYGTEDHHQGFPEIGQKVKDSGLLLALRNIVPENMCVVERSRKDMMEFNANFDSTIYVPGKDGVVVDIRVEHDIAYSNMATSNVDEQAQRYDRWTRAYYRQIWSVYEKLKRKLGDKLKLAPEFHILTTRALAAITQGTGPHVQLTYKQIPMDTYRIRFVVRYLNTPHIGNKISDLSGGKGVICQIAEDDEMPCDEAGNVADIAMDPLSTINRMNPARLYEQYFNGARRDTHRDLCRRFLRVEPGMPCNEAYANISTLSEETLLDAWEHLMGFYAIMSPIQRGWFTSGSKLSMCGVIDGDDAVRYLSEIVELGITIFYPTDNQVEIIDQVLELEDKYPQTYGPVTYKGNSGEIFTTKQPIRIAPVYIILLEKTGDDWSAVSSSKRNHFGVPAKLTKQEKHTRPVRLQTTRGEGESEVRNEIAYVGTRYCAENSDRNNNPKTARMVVDSILDSNEPSNIENCVDRTKIGFSGARPLVIQNHLLMCMGVRFHYQPYVPYDYTKTQELTPSDEVQEQQE